MWIGSPPRGTATVRLIKQSVFQGYGSNENTNDICRRLSMSLALHAYQAIIVFRNCCQKVMWRNRQHTAPICLRSYEMHLLGWQLLYVACAWCEKSCLFAFSSFVIRSTQQANIVMLQYCCIRTYCVDCVVYAHKYLSVTLHQESRGFQVSSMDEIAYTFRIFISPWLRPLCAMHADRQCKYSLCGVLEENSGFRTS